MTWLDKLCFPLEDPKYPQIKRKLVMFDEIGNIIGKCAEGEIACQNNIVLRKPQDYMDDHQLLKLGIPRDLLTDLPYLFERMGILNFDDIDQPISTTSIGDYIWKLNDNSFRYNQIVEFLRTTFEDAV